MSEFKPGDAMRIGCDGRYLTPLEDAAARAIGRRLGKILTDTAFESSDTAEQLALSLHLSPYALMYALHASVSAVEALAGAFPENENLKRLRDGIFNRE